MFDLPHLLRATCGAYDHVIAAAHPSRFLAEVGRALTHIHGVGIVHNDVKASNVLLMYEEKLVAKITDFGLSSGKQGARARGVHEIDGSCKLRALRHDRRKHERHGLTP